jgi:hypothetical protein
VGRDQTVGKSIREGCKININIHRYFEMGRYGDNSSRCLFSFVPRHRGAFPDPAGKPIPPVPPLFEYYCIVLQLEGGLYAKLEISILQN